MFICRERVNLDEKSINKLSDYTCLSAVSRANRALLENDTFRKKTVCRRGDRRVQGRYPPQFVIRVTRLGKFLHIGGSGGAFGQYFRKLKK
jgi:hypothetical protein